MYILLFSIYYYFLKKIYLFIFLENLYWRNYIGEIILERLYWRIYIRGSFTYTYSRFIIIFWKKFIYLFWRVFYIHLFSIFYYFGEFIYGGSCTYTYSSLRYTRLSTRESSLSPFFIIFTLEFERFFCFIIFIFICFYYS